MNLYINRKDFVSGASILQVTDDILKLDGITRIIVTHSLVETLFSRYDGIVVMKDGRIVETGTFEKLMERKGYFYALYMVAQ